MLRGSTGAYKIKPWFTDRVACSEVRGRLTSLLHRRAFAWNCQRTACGSRGGLWLNLHSSAIRGELESGRKRTRAAAASGGSHLRSHKRDAACEADVASALSASTRELRERILTLGAAHGVARNASLALERLLLGHSCNKPGCAASFIREDGQGKSTASNSAAASPPPSTPVETQRALLQDALRSDADARFSGRFGSAAVVAIMLVLARRTTVQQSDACFDVAGVRVESRAMNASRAPIAAPDVLHLYARASAAAARLLAWTYARRLRAAT